MGTINMEKFFKSVAYMLVEKEEGKIENISSGCINILGLNIKKITKSTIKIIDLIPNFFSET